MNKFIIDTLKPLNVPVAFQKYLGDATTYITFLLYNEQGEAWADDQEILTEFSVQVDLWSKSDYTSLANNIKDLMINAGFRRSYAADFYESDASIFHKVIRFYYSK